MIDRDLMIVIKIIKDTLNDGYLKKRSLNIMLCVNNLTGLVEIA